MYRERDMYIERERSIYISLYIYIYMYNMSEAPARRQGCAARRAGGWRVETLNRRAAQTQKARGLPRVCYSYYCCMFVLSFLFPSGEL